jgi:hypothetical protein
VVVVVSWFVGAKPFSNGCAVLREIYNLTNMKLFSVSQNARQNDQRFNCQRRRALTDCRVQKQQAVAVTNALSQATSAPKHKANQTASPLTTHHTHPTHPRLGWCKGQGSVHRLVHSQDLESNDQRSCCLSLSIKTKPFICPAGWCSVQ